MVEGAYDLFKIDAASAGRTEIPTTAMITEGQMRRQDAGFAVERGDGILNMNMEDAIGELADELYRIDKLP